MTELEFLKNIPLWTTRFYSLSLCRSLCVFCTQKKLFGVSYGVIFLLFIAAFCLQMGSFGSPVTFSDSEYYMWGGGQLLEGRVPYIDFWDRKQYGLFLLYSFFYLFGSYRFWASSLGAALCLFGGALALAFILSQFLDGQKFKNLRVFLAGLFFIAGTTAYHGIGGQAEEFYLPLLLICAALILPAWHSLALSSGKLFTTGTFCFFLIGIALELKASCFPFGMLLGLSLLFLLLKNPALSPSKKFLRFCLFGSLWVLLTALPTLLIAGWYAEHHWFSQWYFANVKSAGMRNIWLSDQFEMHNKVKAYGVTGLLGLFFTLTLWKSQTIRKATKTLPKEALLFVLIWYWGEAFLDCWLSAGSDLHYFIPLLAPTAILAGIIAMPVKPLTGTVYLSGLVYFLICAIEADLLQYRWGAADGRHSFHFYKRAEFLVREQPGCIFQPDGISVLYDISEPSHHCILSPIAFPGQLVAPHEQNALPVNPSAERKKILDQLPLYVNYVPRPAKKYCPENGQCDYFSGYNLWRRRMSPDFEKNLEAFQETLNFYYTPILHEYDYDLHPTFFADDSGGVTLYKLRPGLVPKVTPRGILPEPSKRVVYPENWTNHFATRFFLKKNTLKKDLPRMLDRKRLKCLP